MTTLEIFQDGRLSDAIESATADVKEKPSDVDRRGLLADMLCFAGEFDRADKQLEAIATLEPGATMGVALVRQLVRADQWRQQFYLEGRVPEFMGKPNERVQAQLQASILLREGDGAAACELLQRAEEGRAACSGLAGDKPFDNLRDCDDLVAGVFEVFTSTGKYYWIPMENVLEVELRPVERPRDLLWRRARMEVNDGPEGEIYLPALYGPMAADASEEVRLGRVTEWSESEPVRGTGLRTFILGDDAVPVHDLPELRIGAAAKEA